MNDLKFYLGMICLALIFLYFKGRYYLLERFDDKTGPTGLVAGGDKAVKTVTPDTSKSDSAKKTLDLPTTFTTNIPPDRPFETAPIQNMDDYEYSAIFQNEGSRVAGKREISDAMSRYPISWTHRPPSDQLFQDYQTAFTDASEKSPPDISSKKMFDSVSGDDMMPPDKQAIDAEEKKILAMYKPEQPQELKEYSLEDAVDLVKKVYERRGLNADVQKSSQGSNVYEIVEVTEKNPKIIWEDEVERDPVERHSLRGEEQIVVPPTASDIAAGLDPFFEPRTRVRMDRHDYTKWTPGLERQFAPTYTHNEWY